MRVVTVVAVALLLPWTEARAWNSTGHMTVALLAYRNLKPATQAKIQELLKKHPHYGQFLSAEQPANVPEAEWAFLRAATWPDWVRSGPPDVTKYSVPNRHFVDRPFIRPGDEKKVDSQAVKEQNPENALAGLTQCMKSLGDGTAPDEDRAVALCWLLHLVGDVHQPLHCTSFFSAQFPKGDRGGNSFLVVDERGSTVKLHHLWDGLLGGEVGITYAAIDLVATDIQHASRFQRAPLAAALSHSAVDDWIAESSALARDIAYRRGLLGGASSNHSHDDGQIRVPPLPAQYEDLAKEVARKQAALGGFRLADKLTTAFGE